MEDSNYILWDELKKHHGHNLTVDCYKYSDKLINVSLYCKDCEELVLDAGTTTIKDRSDI